MKRTDSLPLSKKLSLAANALSILVFAVLGGLLIGLILSEAGMDTPSGYMPDHVYDMLIVEDYCELPDPVYTLNTKDYPENLLSVGYERAVTFTNESVTVGIVLTFIDGTTRVENITLVPRSTVSWA